MKQPHASLFAASAAVLAFGFFLFAVRSTAPVESEQSPRGARPPPSLLSAPLAIETTLERTDEDLATRQEPGIVELAPIVIVVPASRTPSAGGR
jgi:hypothetical protein